MEQRRSVYLIALLGAAVLFGSGALYARWHGLAVPYPNQVVAPPPIADTGKEKDREPKGEIQVHVAGAVERPGVYRLAQGTRVIDAITLAGPLVNADIHALNLAAPLADGQPVRVPLVGQNGTAVTGGTGNTAGIVAGQAASQGQKVNINTASVKELETLPGIGPALAQRIVDYRTSRGPFRAPEDITGVSGIGPAKYAQIQDLIAVY